MKKLSLCLALAFCATIMYANNTLPLPGIDIQGAKSELLADLDCAPCYVCAACHGQTFCLVCDCSNEDCANKADVLLAILCNASPDCCYVIGSGPK